MITNLKSIFELNDGVGVPLAIGTDIILSSEYVDSVGNQIFASGREYPIPMSGDPSGFNFAFAYGDLVKIRQGRLFSNLASGLVPYPYILDGETSDRMASGPGFFQPKLSNNYLSTPPDSLGFPVFSLSQNIGEWLDLDVEVQQDIAGTASSNFSMYFTANPYLRYKTDLIDSRLNGINYYVGWELIVEHSQPIIWS